MRLAAALLPLAFLATLAPTYGAAKNGMPDLRQVDNTCFPTAAANLIYWFGKNGYPNLLPKSETEELMRERLVLRLIIASQTTFKTGTEFSKLCEGLSQYITQCGYRNVVFYKGLGSDEEFSIKELARTAHSDKGFILCVGVYKNDYRNHLVPAVGENHCLTVMEYHDTFCVALDPAHAKGESGKRALAFKALGRRTVGDRHGNTDEREVYEVLGMDKTHDNLPPGSIYIFLGAIEVHLNPKLPGDPPA